MKELIDKLDEISIKILRIEDIGELLEDYFYNNIKGAEHSKGDTLVTLLVEKIKNLDEDLEKIYKKVFEMKERN